MYSAFRKIVRMVVLSDATVVASPRDILRRWDDNAGTYKVAHYHYPCDSN